MYSEKLITWVNEHALAVYPPTKNNPVNKEMLELLRLETLWIDSFGARSSTTRHRMYIILNNFNETNSPRCKNCEKLAKLNINTIEFSEYCSTECSRGYSRKFNLNKDTLDNPEWLHQKRIIEKLSEEEIAKLIHGSEILVRKALKKHDIIFDGRRKNISASRCLESYEFMYQKYIVENLTFRDIAKLIGSSVATVQRFCTDIHKIQPKNPNSYDRPLKLMTKPEEEIVEYLKSLDVKQIRTGNRSICNGYELDIVLPEFMFAIEYHGLYSHVYRPHETSFAKIKDSSYHLNKTILSNNKGYTLFQIYSDEWRDKKNIIKSMISHRLKKDTVKIYARKCIIKEVSVKNKDAFLMENHIQGADKSTYKFGLYHNDVLVSLMTFSKPRFTKSYDWELSRFCCSNFISVVGGFQKLLKYARSICNGSIISYSDRRFSKGDIYNSSGFKLKCINPPSYYIVDTNKDIRIHRMHFQKKNLPDEFKDMTELEATARMGYHRVYDCGTMTWILN